MQNTNQLYPNRTPIPVICAFDSEGHMRPSYVRISGEAYKVYSSFEKTSFMHALVFQCEIIDHEQLKPLTLEFRHKEHLWLLLT